MKKFLYLIQISLFFIFSHYANAQNNCPKWFPMPANDLVVVMPIYNTSITSPDLDCDGIIDSLDNDIDGDGVSNTKDAFPRNSRESIDTDHDGIGNNADTDDDNDGYSDIDEIIAGSDPLNPNDIPDNQQIHLSDWIRTNPGAGGAFSMMGATAHGKYLVAGSDLSGVYMSEDNGLSWYVKGENNGLGDTPIQALGFDVDNDEIFYVGTTNGIYKTINGGELFTSITDSWDNSDGILVESIVVGANHLYATYHTWTSAEHPSQISVSTDQGASWQTLPPISAPNNHEVFRITKLLIHPDDDTILYALSGNSRFGCSPSKAYRLLYDSATGHPSGWKEISQQAINDTRAHYNNGQINEVNTTIGIFDIEIDIDDKNILYMSTFNPVKCPSELNADEIGKQVPMYAYVADTNIGNIYKSSNKGNTFTSLSTDRDRTGIIFSIGGGKVHLADVMHFEDAWNERNNPNGTEAVWEYTQTNASWSRYDHAQQWNIGPSSNPNYSFGLSFYGVSKTLTKDLFNVNHIYGTYGFNSASFDGGKTFKAISSTPHSSNTWRSTGLDNINGTVLDVSDSNSDIVYMGGYDIGLWVSRNHGESWSMHIPQQQIYSQYVWWQEYDGSENANPGGTNVATLIVDPSNERKVWATFGATQSYGETELEDNGTHITHTGLFKSENYGETWRLITGGNMPDDERMYGLSLDRHTPTNHRTLYMTAKGHVFKSTDDGEHWEQKTPGTKTTCGLPNVQSVQSGTENGCGLKVTAIDAIHSNLIYAGGESGLWKSTDGGAHWAQTGGMQMEADRTRVFHMNRDITPTYNEHQDDANAPYAWEGVFDIKTDPKVANRVYVTVYGAGYANKGGLYRSNNAGQSWEKITLPSLDTINPDRYLRGIAIDPNNSNHLFVSSSESYNSGGSGGTSVGIIASSNAGSTWHFVNNNMAWNYGGMMEIEHTYHGNTPHLWAWSAGTGLQHAEILP